MKKILLTLLLASLGLAGCVAVPVDSRGYAPVAAPLVVVRPWHYGYHGGGRSDYR